MEFVGAAPVQPENDVAARGSGAAKTRKYVRAFAWRPEATPSRLCGIVKASMSATLPESRYIEPSYSHTNMLDYMGMEIVKERVHRRGVGVVLLRQRTRGPHT